MRLSRFQLFVIQQPLLCVCRSFSVLSLIWCCLSHKSTQIKLHDGYTYNKTSTWVRADCITGCAFLHANIFLFWGYTQSACCLIESRARRVSSWWSWLPACGAFFHCVCMSSEAFSSWVSLHLRSLRCPSRFRLCGAVAALVGIAVGSGGGNEDGRSPIFSLSHQIQRPLSGFGSLPHGFFHLERGLDAPLVFLWGGGQKDNMENEDKLCKSAWIVALALFAQACYEWENRVWAVSSKIKFNGWLCSSTPYDLAVPVPLLLRHGATEIAGNRTWIWWTGWRWVRPISTCIPQIWCSCSGLEALAAVLPPWVRTLLKRALPRRRLHYSCSRFIIWSIIFLAVISRPRHGGDWDCGNCT